MRILFFSHYFPPEVNAPASRTYEHCVRWVRAGHEVTVVTCVPNCPDGVAFGGYRNRLWPQREVVDGIQVIRVWTYLAPNAGSLPRIINYVSYMISALFGCLFARRPDVIIATSPQFFCGWAGVLASWLRWRPFVLEIRDIWPDSISAVGAMSNPWVIRFLEFLERRLYRAATCIVAVGEGYKRHICEKVPTVTEHIHVIPNGVDPELFQPLAPDEAFRAQWKLGNRFVCAYVGTIGMAHGLDVVVRAAQRLVEAGRDDIAFLLVGDGAHRAHLEKQVTAKSLESHVLFTGRLPREMMPRALASVDTCLIHLRATELFESVIPSKIFETLAMGRPIIMGVKGLARDIVAQAEAGIPLTPEDDHELAQIVTQLADRPEAMAALSTSARAFVVQHYNRNRWAVQYANLLEQIVGSGTAAVTSAIATHRPAHDDGDSLPSAASVKA